MTETACALTGLATTFTTGAAGTWNTVSHCLHLIRLPRMSEGPLLVLPQLGQVMSMVVAMTKSLHAARGSNRGGGIGSPAAGRRTGTRKPQCLPCKDSSECRRDARTKAARRSQFAA